MSQDTVLDELVGAARSSFAAASNPAELENAKAQLLGKAGRAPMKKGQSLCKLQPAFATPADPERPADVCQVQAASLALTWATMAPKAALSWMARSERTLRSISMPAFFRPLANWL